MQFKLEAVEVGRECQEPLKWILGLPIEDFLMIRELNMEGIQLDQARPDTGYMRITKLRKRLEVLDDLGLQVKISVWMWLQAL